MKKNIIASNSLHKFGVELQSIAAKIDLLRFTATVDGFNDIKDGSSIGDLILGLDAIEERLYKLYTSSQGKKDRNF